MHFFLLCDIIMKKTEGKSDMFADTHLHTSFSGDSETPPEHQLERAIELGMTSLCFTDHHDYDLKSDVDFSLDIKAYLGAMRELREKYREKIHIGIGVELGLQLHIADYIGSISDTLGEMDFVIGSNHAVDGLDPYFPEYFELNGTNSYQRYFEATLKRIKRIKDFDSLGHLDYIVRYGAKRGLSYSYKEYADVIDEILKQIIYDGKALECNSGALSRGMSETNPCADVLRRYRELGGELVTLGSDAHTPDTLGYKFDECADLLRGCGFKYIAFYEKRKPIMQKLF